MLGEVSELFGMARHFLVLGAVNYTHVELYMGWELSCSKGGIGEVTAKLRGVSIWKLRSLYTLKH